MKIAVIGTHGIGKTTLAYQIAAEAKIKGKNAIVINEVARTCPFPLNEDFSIDGATWIVTSQINRELSAKASKHDIIVCDRSAYDPICYLQAGKFPASEFQRLRMFAEEWLKTYDKIIYVKPIKTGIVDDGVRNLDKEFQITVDKRFRDYIDSSLFYLDNYYQIVSHEIFSETAIDHLELGF